MLFQSSQSRAGSNKVASAAVAVQTFGLGQVLTLVRVVMPVIGPQTSSWVVLLATRTPLGITYGLLVGVKRVAGLDASSLTQAMKPPALS